ncbi:DUF3800 domain-containing protein [Companilactobacillus sp.]|jgi:hypothetical protein|uniref:DUF3800 domain-containing protein n=1 Tax=Companilactobacillus sp. TaxID=2767905 RepID=UPI0025C5BA54|nr:DUF3800 domain-containing protein [Companilactobacillus sp.]MCH4008497.1 DUF3800 domain-containing protein [Companilactobacillus sp.]MCH4051324.1 DUF3800 domain-containing protein [Companilactobacillus sp.]MCH4076440.1 DUF3800 domain-containing protein [Companilactobacillus sp.]MCH4125015.1 DUF3800 domain-containing protein [Companilactobacillus sp.]MCH4131557.1 DUF3800 domain-containing protein [Companilactobacillus sp.]
MLFIDESGSITRSKNPKKRYFIISIVETEEPYKVRRVFRRAKKNFITHNPNLQMNYSVEVKGSQMPVKMKRYILDQVLEKTDAKFHYIVIDNNFLSERFHDDVELCFNYVIGNYLKQFIPKNYQDDYNLKMTLDERNCTVSSINSLKDYLTIKFCFESSVLSDVSQCSYADSKEKDVLQVADVFANLVFRACLADKDSQINGNCVLLKDIGARYNMYFPYRNNTLRVFSNDVYYD